MAETKAQLQAKFDNWQAKVEEALSLVEKKDYSLQSVKKMVAILLMLVGRPEE
jgi:hypothetical protein